MSGHKFNLRVADFELVPEILFVYVGYDLSVVFYFVLDSTCFQMIWVFLKLCPDILDLLYPFEMWLVDVLVECCLFYVRRHY